MIRDKKLLVLATAGVVALGYAVVSTNAFADTSVGTPIPAVSTSATATAAITPPPVPSIPTDISAIAGIQASSGLANSSLSTMPSGGDDDGDDQTIGLSAGVSLSGDDSGDDQTIGLSAGVSLSGDDSGDDDSGNSSSVGVSVSLSDDNGADSQQNNDGQDGSGSDD